MRTFFEKHADVFNWVEPIAGVIAFPSIRSDVAIDINNLADDLREKKGVLLLPGFVNFTIVCLCVIAHVTHLETSISDWDLEEKILKKLSISLKLTLQKAISLN